MEIRYGNQTETESKNVLLRAITSQLISVAIAEVLI